MYKPTQLLSENRKTGVSIDFPIEHHCRPTKVCKKTCYAHSGFQSFPNSKRKQRYVSDYLKGGDITQLINECIQRTSVRLSGAGDLLLEHVPNLVSLAKACPQTMFWGMTRKVEIAEAINKSGLPNLKLLVSVDASSPDSVWNYPGKMCFGPRLEGDNDSRLGNKNIVTIFPYHFHGEIVGQIPETEKDCPAVRHKMAGCFECQRCWNWK